MISSGLAKLRASGKPFLPAPGEFAKSCLPCAEDFGFPSERDAYTEGVTESGKYVANRKFSHPAVYRACVKFGFKALAVKTERESWPLFKKIYKEVCESALAGKPLTLPPEVRLDVKAQEVASKETASKHLNVLTGMFS